MFTSACQRWRDRRGSYRVKGEPIDTHRYEVALIEDQRAAKDFVRQHHYSGTFPTAIFRAGLYRGPELVGVAVLSNGASAQAMEVALPVAARRAELGRFVLRDDVPANGESWFLARVFELARRAGFEAVVAYSDPERRYTAYGQLVFGGHIGTIYQASNAIYTGKTKVRTRYYFPDGALLTDRELTKLREKQKGWQYVVAKLRVHGAPRPRGDYHAWRRRALAEVMVTRRHRGSHRYLWALDKKLCRHLPDGMTYPKIDVGRSAP